MFHILGSSSHTAVNNLVTGHSAQRQVVLQDKFLEVDLVSQWVFAFAVWRDSGQLLFGALSSFIFSHQQNMSVYFPPSLASRGLSDFREFYKCDG